MTALDDSFILTCISIPGTEYTWIKSGFRKYRNILSESEWYSNIKIRLYNSRLYFDENAFTFSVFCICFHQSLYMCCLMLVWCSAVHILPYLITIFLSPLLEQLPELLNLSWIINRLSKMGPQCFNQSWFPTLPELSLSVFFFNSFLFPTDMQAEYLPPILSKICLNLSKLQST